MAPLEMPPPAAAQLIRYAGKAIPMLEGSRQLAISGGHRGCLRGGNNQCALGAGSKALSPLQKTGEVPLPPVSTKATSPPQGQPGKDGAVPAGRLFSRHKGSPAQAPQKLSSYS